MKYALARRLLQEAPRRLRIRAAAKQNTAPTPNAIQNPPFRRGGRRAEVFSQSGKTFASSRSKVRLSLAAGRMKDWRAKDERAGCGAFARIGLAGGVIVNLVGVSVGDGRGAFATFLIRRVLLRQ